MSGNDRETMRREASAMSDETLAKELAFAEGFGETEGIPETHDWIIALRDEHERRRERVALRREARQAAMLDAGPILAEHRRAKGE